MPKTLLVQGCVALLCLRRHLSKTLASLILESRRFIRHPVYVTIVESGYRKIPEFPNYQINEWCQILGGRGVLLSESNNDKRVMLCRPDGYRIRKRIYHLALLTFYPDMKPDQTVDHIDGNYHNNHISNLRWMTFSANKRKNVFGVPSKSGLVQSKPIWLLSCREGAKVTRYESAHHAAFSAVMNVILNVGNVGRSAMSGGRVAVSGYFFAYEEQPDLDGEEWRTSVVLDRVLKQKYKPEHRKIMVSSFGRIRNARGIKKVGCKAERDGGGFYRITRACGMNFRDHQLIFMGWFNKQVPRKDERDADGNMLVICHDDFAPKDEDGCHRNWPATDLSIGTQSQNSLQSWESRRQNKD